MPILFISYKRGTSAIQPLMARLIAAHYRLWYDQDDIHAGENWRESINRGVDGSDALVIGLTPAACRSEFVQYEVQRSLEQNKLLFPVKLEAIDENNDPHLLGLTDIQFIDFTQDWEADCTFIREEEIDLSECKKFHAAYRSIGRFLKDVYPETHSLSLGLSPTNLRASG